MDNVHEPQIKQTSKAYLLDLQGLLKFRSYFNSCNNLQNIFWTYNKQKQQMKKIIYNIGWSSVSSMAQSPVPQE